MNTGPTAKGPMTDAEYISKGGGECPFCRDDRIEGEQIEINGREATQRVGCTECGAYWVDVYTLTSFEFIESFK